MLPNYDLIEPDKALYSEEFYLLLAWGRANLFFSEQIDIISKIKESWALIKNESYVEKSIVTSLNQYSQDLKNSLQFLNNIKSIKQENLEQVQLCLTILDIGIFFSVAFENISDQFTEQVNNLVSDIIDRITIDIISSNLRLIPLNGMRQEIKNSIPEDTICYFPWYDEWTELPVNTFDIIAENWKDFAKTDIKLAKKLGLSLEYFNLFIHELTIDKELLRYIKRQARFYSAMEYAVKNSISIRLFLISNKQAVEYPVSIKIKNKGLLNSAYHAIYTTSRPLKNELDRLERLFLAAFCGPYLNDKQRIDLLSDIEKRLPEIDPGLIKSGSPLESLYKWSQQKLSDNKMADNIFRYWIKMLNNAKVEQFAPSFWHAVTNVQCAEISKHIDWIPDWIKELFISKPFNKQLPVLSKSWSGGSEDKEKTDIKLDKNYIELPLEYDEDDELEIPGKHKDTEKLIEFIKLVNYYWIGWLKIKGKDVQKIEQQVEKRDYQYPDIITVISKEEYEYVLIGISDKEEILKNLLEGQNISEEQKTEIIWLIYT